MRSVVAQISVLLAFSLTPNLCGQNTAVDRDSLNEVSLRLVDAPPLKHAGVENRIHLGDWHDIIVLPDADNIILRRDETCYELDASANGQLTKVGDFDALRNSKFVFSARHDDSTWLFFESSTSAPFVINLKTGRTVLFDIPGLKLPGSHAPQIQSWVLAERLGGVVLEISGGDRASWPRTGNRPVFFWFGTMSGQATRMPIGCDLDYLSADQTVAIFDNPHIENLKSRGKFALEMRTGKEVDSVPDKQADSFTPWDWSETGPAKEVRAPESRSKTELPPGALIGVSIPGSMWRFSSHFGNKAYFHSPQINDGWLCFQVRPYGQAEAPTLYCCSLADEIVLQQMSLKALNFQLLPGGLCVYSERGHGEKGDSHEVFLGNPTKGTTWNVLDDIDRLPTVSPDLSKKPYIEDKMRVRLVQSFGSAHDFHQVMCLFIQQQGDMRSFVYPSTAPGNQLPIQIRRKTILVGPGEQRTQLDVLTGNQQPERIWLHDTGRLYLGYDALSTRPGENRSIRLHRVKLETNDITPSGR